MKGYVNKRREGEREGEAEKEEAEEEVEGEGEAEKEEDVMMKGTVSKFRLQLQPIPSHPI